MLSPHMPDSVFDERLGFIQDRGCNYVNLFLCNNRDGEYGGYSIYGNGVSFKVSESYVAVMRDRIERLRKLGFGIVLWLVADDDNGWNSALSKIFRQYVEDIAGLGLFNYASMVVLGLELDEYWKSASTVKANVDVLRGVYGGKVGIHCTANKWDWASLGDVLFYQTEDKISAENAERKVRTVVANCGKPVCAFEMNRNEKRDVCEAAFRAGAFSVGNW